MKSYIKSYIGRGCLAFAGILFLLFLYRYNQFERVSLYETEGRTFEKATVIEVLQDNESLEGVYIGSQEVLLRIDSGEHKGEEIEAISSSGYLYGTHCTDGKKVIAVLSESAGEVVASVYSADRGAMIWLIVGIFVLMLIMIGGKKGLYSVLGLAFTFLCIIGLFLPMIYKGHSPIAAAILVVILTTFATMYLIAGATKKAVCAAAGTVIGIMISGLFAALFGKLTEIGGYNVSDIEDLIYVQEQVGIDVGELLFCGILIAALGAVMDVAMSITSTIEELSIKNPQLDWRELFGSGMHVGKDMMGTMSNTLVLAFAGGSINTLVFLYVYNYEYRQLINMYSLGVEIIQGLASSIGVILIVPIVSFIAAAAFGKKAESDMEME